MKLRLVLSFVALFGLCVSACDLHFGIGTSPSEPAETP